MHFSAQKHGQTLCLGPCFWLASLGRRVHLSVVCLWDSVSEFRLLPFCSAKVPTENSQQATATANCLCCLSVCHWPLLLLARRNYLRWRIQAVTTPTWTHTPPCFPFKSSMDALLFRKSVSGKQEKKRQQNCCRPKVAIFFPHFPRLSSPLTICDVTPTFGPMPAKSKVGLWVEFSRVAVTCSW